MAVPSWVLVPRPSSSRMTSDFGVAWAIISEVSYDNTKERRVQELSVMNIVRKKQSFLANDIASKYRKEPMRTLSKNLHPDESAGNLERPIHGSQRSSAKIARLLPRCL